MKFAVWTCLVCGSEFRRPWRGEASIIAWTCSLCGGTCLASHGTAYESGLMEVVDVDLSV